MEHLYTVYIFFYFIYFIMYQFTCFVKRSDLPSGIEIRRFFFFFFVRSIYMFYPAHTRSTTTTFKFDFVVRSSIQSCLAAGTSRDKYTSMKALPPCHHAARLRPISLTRAT